MLYPQNYNDDVSLAINILKNEGCSEVYLFGSITNGNSNNESDIDIAIKGLPRTKYFSVYGKLMSTLNHNVDLVMLDIESNFTKYLIEKGNLRRVA